MSRKLPVAVLATALVVGALAAATVAGAATKAKVTISAQQGGFSGFVISGLDKCHNGRRVTLFKKVRRKANPKKDKRIGSDVATPNGDGSQWRISTDARGRFYAYVGRKSGCSRAFSKSVSAAPKAEDDEG